MWRSSPFSTKQSTVDGFWGREVCAPPLAPDTRPTWSKSPWIAPKTDNGPIVASQAPKLLAATGCVSPFSTEVPPEGNGRPKHKLPNSFLYTYCMLDDARRLSIKSSNRTPEDSQPTCKLFEVGSARRAPVSKKVIRSLHSRKPS